MSEQRQTEILETTRNKATNAFVTIGEELNEAVNGNRYSANYLTTLDTATSLYIGITTPSDLDIRLTSIELGCDLNYATAILYEDVTFTGTDELVCINNNRQSIKTCSVNVYTGFSVAPNITGATELDIIATLGGTGVAFSSTGGSQSGNGFFVLKRDAKYAILVSNEDGVTANLLIKIPFMETDLTD